MESEEIHSITHSCQAFRHVCVCVCAATYPEMQSWFPWTVPLFAGFLFTPDFQITPSPSCSKVSISLCYALSPRVNETLPLPESPPLSLSLLESNLSSTRWSLMLSGAGSFRCHAQFLSTPDGKIGFPFVPGLLWHRSTSGFVWREDKR